MQQISGWTKEKFEAFLRSGRLGHHFSDMLDNNEGWIISCDDDEPHICHGWRFTANEEDRPK